MKTFPSEVKRDSTCHCDDNIFYRHSVHLCITHLLHMCVYVYVFIKHLPLFSFHAMYCVLVVVIDAFIMS